MKMVSIVTWWILIKIEMVVKMFVNHKKVWYRAIIISVNVFALKKYDLKGRTFTAIAKS